MDLGLLTWELEDRGFAVVETAAIWVARGKLP